MVWKEFLCINCIYFHFAKFGSLHTHTQSLKRPKRSSFLGLSLVWIYIGSFYFLFLKNLVLEQVRSAVLLCSSVQGLPFPSCDGVSVAEPVKGDQECGMEKD